MRLFQKQFQSPRFKETVQVGVGVDERLVDEALVHVNKTLALSLGILGFGLISAAGLQVSFGLRPLNRVRQALTAIRTGAAKKLPDNLPKELAPLVNDLNALIAANHNMVQRARVQAGNLAHALKTPLAILMDEAQSLQKAGQAAAGRLLIQQCGRMQRQIEYQVARARAVTRVTPGMATKTDLIIKNTIEALSRLHQDRAIIFELNDSEDMLVACDPEDFSEMIGNLISNAAKWAHSKIIVLVQKVNSSVRIVIEDDGPGVPPESVETVFEIGERLDESKPGSGLGLAITRDLAMLYGGKTWIERSELGGAAAVIELPLAC